MRISKIRLQNWRNFQNAEAAELVDVVYIMGANASGKSNLLDAIRFLRDIAKTRGGGLQQAVESRGGIQKLRCLHARNITEVRIEIEVSDHDGAPIWSYSLGLNYPRSGAREVQVTHEQVAHYDSRKSGFVNVLVRPNKRDRADSFLLRETSMEQASANAEFRELVNFFGSVAYVHLVPQLLKFGDEIGGRIVENDPFGQEFLLRISRTSTKTRDARLRRIEASLKGIVPHLENLQFVKDEASGRPHLEMRFKHFRPHGARQREDQFSDGTLRLISLLWLIQENSASPLLLEEPELSLNEDIVRQLPDIFQSVIRKQKVKRQIILTTHSDALLSNSGIDSAGLVKVIPSSEGSSLEKVSAEEEDALEAGFTPAEAVLTSARKAANGLQMTLLF